MSYQIVILNGANRGKRLELRRSSLTLGRGASCDIQLPDPLISEIHAEITFQDDSLQICVADKTNRLLVNKTDVQATRLKHGDVLEMGATRLFIQFQRNASKWESLTGLYRWRKWISIGLPILLISGIALTLNRCRPQTSQPPVANPALHINYSPSYTDTNNTDWMVTNIPRIQIHSTVVLSPSPPEVIEAKLLFILARTNNIQQEIDISLKEIEFATEFLEEARKKALEKQAIPEVTPQEAMIQQAEAVLAPTSSISTQSMESMALPNMAVNEVPTNQANNLKN